MIRYSFVAGGKVSIKSDVEPCDRTWLQGTLPVGFILRVEGPWPGDPQFIAVNHPDWGTIPIQPEHIVPHYDPGDRFRFHNWVDFGGWGESFRSFVGRRGRGHTFTVATYLASSHPQVTTVDLDDEGHPFLFGSATLLHYIFPVVGPRPCSCPIAVLMATGCRCGGE